MKLLTRKNLLKSLLLGATVVVSACSGGNSGGGGGGRVDEMAPTSPENPVRLDSLGVFPASDSSAASYLLQLTNYSADKYTLESARVIDVLTGKDSTLVSVASQACSVVSANGSCSIQLTPHTLKSTEVKLEVTIKDNQGKSKTLYQLIRISGKLGVNNGGIAMINDVSRIVSEDGNYSLSIPVMLGDNYDDIKASNGSLLCNAPGYLKGNSCTYQVSGKASGSGAVVSTRLEGVKSGQVVTVQEANTRVEIGKGAHILLGHGLAINTPETTGKLTVYNSGNTDATAVAASTADSSLEVTAGDCKGTLAPNASCNLDVKVKGNTNGQGVVEVAYKDQATAYNSIANVEYTVANAVAGVGFTQISSNLENALIGGKKRIAEVEIKNTGNRKLQKIKYYLAPATGEFKVIAGSSTACGLDGNHSLDVQASCRVKIEYTAASEKTGSINLVLNGEYSDQYGQEHSLVKEHGLSYSATKAGPLSWTRTVGLANLTIQSNNTEKEEAVYALSNTIAADEGLSATLSSDIGLNPNNINGLTVAPEDAGSCANGGSIAGGAQCSYKVTYGPVSAVQAATDVALQAKYKLGGENRTTDSEKFQVSASATPVVSIGTSVSVKKSPIGLSGDGSSTKPYSFTALSNNTLELEYTFDNKGTAEAAAFNVTTGNLPAGTKVTGGDCPTGATTSTLGIGASCTATVSVPNPNVFEGPNLPGSTVNEALLNMVLPYSYSKGGQVIVENEPDNRTYAKFSRLWGTGSQTTETNNETTTAYTFDIKSTYFVASGTPGVSKPITVRPYLSNPLSGASLQSCDIAEGQDSCINKLTIPKSLMVPGANLKVSFEAKGTGMADKDAIINTFPLLIPSSDVRLTLDSQYVPVWYTNAEALDVLPGNHGYIHLTNAGGSYSGKVTAKALQQAEVINNECTDSGVPPNGECYIEVKATGASPIVQVTSPYGTTQVWQGSGLTSYGRVGGLASGEGLKANPKAAVVRPVKFNPTTDLMVHQIGIQGLRIRDTGYNWEREYNTGSDWRINRWASSFAPNGSEVGVDPATTNISTTSRHGFANRDVHKNWAMPFREFNLGGWWKRDYQGAHATVNDLITSDYPEIVRRAEERSKVFKSLPSNEQTRKFIEFTRDGSDETQRVEVRGASLQGFYSSASCDAAPGQAGGITGVITGDISRATADYGSFCVKTGDWDAGSNGNQVYVMHLTPETDYARWGKGKWRSRVDLRRGQIAVNVSNHISPGGAIINPSAEALVGGTYTPSEAHRSGEAKSWYTVTIPLEITIP